MSKVYVGLDNGCTASIGILGLSEGAVFSKPPVKKVRDYHKNAKRISRIDYPKFCEWLETVYVYANSQDKEMVVVMEKPYTGIATTAILAGRAYEAEIIALEQCGIKFVTISASDWQGTKKNKGLLPLGLKPKETKKASRDLGISLWPHLSEKIKKHGDADGLLIAKWAEMNSL